MRFAGTWCYLRFFYVAQNSRGAATSNSLGREPQEIVAETNYPWGSRPRLFDAVPPGLKNAQLQSLRFGLLCQAVNPNS